MTAYENVTDALRSAGMKVAEGPNGARSQCPAHGSRGLSLAVRPNPRNPDGPLHVTCFAGCETEEVLTALGLALRDLYDGDRQHAGVPRERRKPSPWDLLGDPEHFAGRCLQQQQIEGTFDRLTAVDVAWAAHCAESTPRQALTPPVVFDDPARQSSFAEWIAERLEADPTLAPPAGRVVLRGSNGRNRVFDPGDPGYDMAVRLAAEVTE